MMGQDFAAAVERCLQRLDRGENLLEVLADYPASSEKLEPLLLVAMASRAFPVPIPGQTAQRLGRNQMLAEMGKLEDKGAFRKRTSIPLTSWFLGTLAGVLRSLGYHKLAYSYRLAMVSLVLVLSGGFLTLNASASSQPGDLLYTLKMGMERAGLVWVIAGEDPVDDLVLPGKSEVRSERSIAVLEGVNGLLTGTAESLTPPAFASANLDGAAVPDPTEEDWEPKDADKEVEKALAEAERLAEQELKEEEKALAEAERLADQEQKEAAKAAAAEEREEEKALKEAEKDAAQQTKDAERQAAKQNKAKDDKNSNIDKPAGNTNQGKGNNKSK
jgi:hypothetical protein